MQEAAHQAALLHLSQQCGLNPTSAQAFLDLFARANPEMDSAQLYTRVLQLTRTDVEDELAHHPDSLAVIAQRLEE